MDSRLPSLSQTQLSSVCSMYNIGIQYQPTLPKQDQPVNQPPDGMVGVFVDFFGYGNLRLPLRPFFLQILKHYNIHICQLVPLAVSKVTSFDMLCCALNITPTVDLFRCFSKLAPVEDGTQYTFSSRPYKCIHDLKGITVRKWQDKYFFVKIEDVMIMRQKVPVSDTKPKKGSYREQDVEILSLYTFKLGSLPQEILWKTGFSIFKTAGDKKPTQLHDPEGAAAACLLNYEEYVVKKASNEKYHEEEGNVGIGEKLAGAENMQVGTENMQVGTENMQVGTKNMQFGTENMQIGTENLQFDFDFPEEDLELIKKFLESPCKDAHEVKNDQIQNFVEQLQNVIHVKDQPIELIKEKQALEAEIAMYENQLSDEDSLSRKLSCVDYPNILSQVTALNATEKGESVELRTNKITWKDHEEPFHLAQILTLKSKSQEIKKVVDDVDKLCRSEFDKKNHELSNTFRTQQHKLKVCENERQSLENDVSWLTKEGIEMAIMQFMNSEEFYSGLSLVISDAVRVGNEKATRDIDRGDSHGVDRTHLQFNVDEAIKKKTEDRAKLKEVMEAWVTSLNEQKIQELKKEVPKQTLEDGLRKLIARLCGGLLVHQL